MSSNKILLIDDDIDDQFIFLDALKEISFDHECIIANNGIEALALLTENPLLVDAIFLDLNMPLMNGFEFFIILKKDSRLSQIPVIIYSTSDNPEDQKRMKEFGAIKFITKTADFKNLKASLINILKVKSTGTTNLLQ
jgi:CheY-like chemotaxis protein